MCLTMRRDQISKLLQRERVLLGQAKDPQPSESHHEPKAPTVSTAASKAPRADERAVRSSAALGGLSPDDESSTARKRVARLGASPVRFRDAADENRAPAQRLDAALAASSPSLRFPSVEQAVRRKEQELLGDEHRAAAPSAPSAPATPQAKRRVLIDREEPPSASRATPRRRTRISVRRLLSRPSTAASDAPGRPLMPAQEVHGLLSTVRAKTTLQRPDRRRWRLTAAGASRAPLASSQSTEAVAPTSRATTS
eukprot:gene18176-13051_t